MENKLQRGKNGKKKNWTKGKSKTSNKGTVCLFTAASLFLNTNIKRRENKAGTKTPQGERGHRKEAGRARLFGGHHRSVVLWPRE